MSAKTNSVAASVLREETEFEGCAAACKLSRQDAVTRLSKIADEWLSKFRHALTSLVADAARVIESTKGKGSLLADLLSEEQLTVVRIHLEAAEGVAMGLRVNGPGSTVVWPDLAAEAEEEQKGFLKALDRFAAASARLDEAKRNAKKQTRPKKPKK